MCVFVCEGEGGERGCTTAATRGAAARTPRVTRALVQFYAGKGMGKEDMRRVQHEIFIRSVLLTGSRVR